MWSSYVPYHLPKSKGNYIPGVMDVMLGYGKDGLFMRLYYPTNEEIQIVTKHEKWPTVLPSNDYLQGISDVTGVPALLLNAVSLCYSAWNLNLGHMKIPALYGENIKTDDKLKILIFSHGLGALRSFYSSIFIELASRGYLVAVMEHRDESACHTYYYESEFAAKNNEKTTIPFKNVPIGPGHYETRIEQVKQRTDEVCKAVDFFIDLNNGKVPHNVINDISDEESHFKLSDLVGKIDMDNLLVGGHSFGGATALRVLARRKDLKLGIILDPWMFPVKAEKLETKITQPLLFINTQTFHIKNNIKSLEQFLNDGENTENREMYTIMKSTHETQTDSVFLVGYWLNWFMKKINPKLGLQVNNNLILKFLKERTKHSEDIKCVESFLKDGKEHYTSGLTKPWA